MGSIDAFDGRNGSGHGRHSWIRWDPFVFHAWRKQMESEQKVVVVDVRMKFGSMVIFLVKLAIAAIPAAIILTVIGSLIVAVFGGLLSGLSR